MGIKQAAVPCEQERLCCCPRLYLSALRKHSRISLSKLFPQYIISQDPKEPFHRLSASSSRATPPRFVTEWQAFPQKRFEHCIQERRRQIEWRLQRDRYAYGHQQLVEPVDQCLIHLWRARHHCLQFSY